jgi:hypothetical protein
MKTGSAFVYKLTNLVSGKIYIGFHKGSPDDSYVCSSRNYDFWQDYNTPGVDFKREIIFTGNLQECQEQESKLLSEVYNCSTCYNFSDGKHKFFLEGKYVGYQITTKYLKVSNELPKEIDLSKWLWYKTQEYTDLGYYGLKEDIKNSRTKTGRLKLKYKMIKRRWL